MLTIIKNGARSNKCFVSTSQSCRDCVVDFSYALRLSPQAPSRGVLPQRLVLRLRLWRDYLRPSLPQAEPEESNGLKSPITDCCTRYLRFSGFQLMH